MGPPLCVTSKEQHSMIRFLWLEDLSGTAIHQELSAQYGDGVLPQQSL
jgi:hypothetical protein